MKRAYRTCLLPAGLLLAGTLLGLNSAIGGEAIAGAGCGFSPERAGFSVRVRDEICPYRVMGVFVFPGELLSLEVEGGGEGRTYRLNTTAGRITRTQTNHWFWRAPRATGLYPIVIAPVSAPDTSSLFPPVFGAVSGRDAFPGREDAAITLNVFVMVPSSEMENECLQAFRIGRYPPPLLKDPSLYEPPRGFIEVTEENQETLVSPHFRIGQFLCKQECGCPKYLVLRERLLLKLERLLEEFNRRGYCCRTLHIMSGYRTPYYNRLIGNVAYSRHLWGDAVDFFIDQDPLDGMMDDLNGNGRIDYQDAVVLYDIIEEISERPWYEKYIGGLGWYRKTSSHGPFVHIDVRGHRARW